MHPLLHMHGRTRSGMIVRSCAAEPGRTEVINGRTYRSGTVFRRVTPSRSHRFERRRGTNRRTAKKSIPCVYTRARCKDNQGGFLPRRLRQGLKIVREERETSLNAMLKKILSKSGRRILRAIKKLSRSRKAKRSCNPSSWHTAIPDFETTSLSWSLPSLDTKSIDTYMTYIAENSEDCTSSCCCCDEYEENQKNENRENEMII